MSLSQSQMDKYGLTLSDATASDHDKGIVAHGDKFYSIDGFKREQKADIDTDQGDVFSSSLEKDAGVDYTNFNTATDVENALRELDGEGTPATIKPDDRVMSERLATAKERVKEYEDRAWSGESSQAIFGKDPGSFLEKYKQNFLANHKSRVKQPTAE